MEQENIVLTLSNGKKYAIVKVLEYENSEYFYLIDTEDEFHQILCEVIDTKLKPITNPEQINQIVLNAKEKTSN